MMTFKNISIMKFLIITPLSSLAPDPVPSSPRGDVTAFMKHLKGNESQCIRDRIQVRTGCVRGIVTFDLIHSAPAP